MAIRRSYVTFFNHNPGDVDRRILELERRIDQMAGELAALTAVVNGLTESSQNMILLVNQQGAMIKDLQAGQVDLTPVVNATAALGAIKTALDEAVTANTPPPPAP